ncbi:hypothetical protein TrispH2_000921 [Trichoplax sp. H2]|nr:hypothetical protein TrispH2_000921 [Trichoplax sp. H2]|eukprot:RDD46567.1 hypothetical protein TrispH2_000921 [Trichoplax sp. H2]
MSPWLILELFSKRKWRIWQEGRSHFGRESLWTRVSLDESQFGRESRSISCPMYVRRDATCYYASDVCEFGKKEGVTLDESQFGQESVWTRVSLDESHGQFLAQCTCDVMLRATMQVTS